MKVIVCGGRNFTDPEMLTKYLDMLHAIYRFDVVIHGNQRGADQMAGGWARSRHIDEERYPAQWKQYGRSAGPIRNTEMLVKGKPKIVIAFPGGSGTRDMIVQATDAGIMVINLKSHTVLALIEVQHSVLCEPLEKHGTG